MDYLDIVSEIYKEYQFIHSLFDSSISLNDDLEVLSITVKKDFYEKELEELLCNLKNFKVYVNPSGVLLSDFMEEVKMGIHSLDIISNINIQFEKKTVISTFEKLDHMFFDCKSMLKNLSNSHYQPNIQKKYNIALPDINRVETIFFNFIPFSELYKSNGINDVPINKSYVENIEFYYQLLRLDKSSNNNNPFLYIITKSSPENDKEELTLNIMQKFYRDVLEFTSDSTSQDMYSFKGNKTIKIYKDQVFNTASYNDLNKLFIFLVSGEKFLEKITIVRNVFSIYLNDENTLDEFDLKLNEIWDTIQHYFHSYVSEDLKDFFKNRDSLFKEAMAVSRSINDQTDKLNTAINGSLISLVVGAAASMYTSIVKNNLVILGISLAIFIGFSIVYYLYTKKHVKDREGLIKNQFEHFINNVYILEEKEKQTFKNKYFKEPSTLLMSTLKRFKYLFFGVNIFIFILFVSLLLYSLFISLEIALIFKLVVKILYL